MLRRFPRRVGPPSDPSARPFRRIDFHSHSYLTDGDTSATEMWHAARLLEHRALALTDHVSIEDPRPLLDRLHEEAAAWADDHFRPVVGVEITKVPPRRIADVARAARHAGAEIVIVHGETISESVPSGTNHAAIDSGLVDVLAHPGLIAPEDVDLARAHGVVLEISARRAHAFTNGHVAGLALERGVELVVDSDAHAPEQLVPPAFARRLALGAGVPAHELERVLETTPERLLAKLRRG